MNGRRLPAGAAGFGAACLLIALSWPLPAAAQRPDADRPPPPVAPAIINRNERGQATVRAVKLDRPLTVDGRLDEEVYGVTPSIDGFIQNLPREGQPSTERTEAWVFFDSTSIYVCGRLWESAPPEQWTANELRRDTAQLRQNDNFGVVFDTFHDRRNGFKFYTNPLGARADQVVTDEGNPNADWNPVWYVRTGRFEGGWTVEMAIPFKSIRYISGQNQTWGLQIRRSIRRKNEWTFLTALPAALGGSSADFRVSLFADLVGLDLPPASRNMELKPYAISTLTTDRVRTPPLANEVKPNAGVDFKYGVTANLTADVTYNTDFAQVEVDEQQVNLTRFNIVFPEKREFFLEGRGLFDFATGSGAGSGNNAGTNVVPLLFYSRRIGLNAGRPVPIDVGTRLTGKAGRYGIGLMNIRTGADPSTGTPATNFTVMRVKRDILRRSNVGALFSNRSHATAGDGQSQAFGADASFSFFQNVNLTGYYARTRMPGVRRDDDSYQGRFDYSADRYGARLDYLHVGDNFTPDIGFVRRDNFTRRFGTVRFSPRIRRVRSIRQLTWQASGELFVNGAGQTESKLITASFQTELENSDLIRFQIDDAYELLNRPFAVARTVTLPTGGYDFTSVTTTYVAGQQRRMSGTISLQQGQFYDGDITALSLSSARIAITTRLSLEPSISLNNVHLPAGDFLTALYRARTDYGFTPRMFAGGLMQYSSNDRSFSSNFRFRWEYKPGSELFAVYADERLTAGPTAGLRNRSIALKITRLFRF
ncbi:MAG: DUF5916 domain-containing protein [Vicinamibacterales bacterium]